MSVDPGDSLDLLAARVAAHLHRLCVEIGPRPGGSPTNQEAAEYIAGMFRFWGLAVETQEFDCSSWQEIETRLVVDNVPISAAANPFSPPCDVAGRATLVRTISELETADLTGRIAVLLGDLTATPLAPVSWHLTSERDKRIVQLLAEKAPIAVLTVQPRLAELERLIEDPDFALPSATVPARAALALLGQGGTLVRLRIDSRRTSGKTWNVVGRTLGATPYRIALCAHYDTKVDTPGALDNGGGVATLLAVVELLARQDRALGMECIAFGNEESVPEGTAAYMAAHEARLGEIIALLNFDGVGHALDVDTVTMMAHSAPFQDLVLELARDQPALIWTDPWPQSNHAAFAWRGVPALAFTSPATRHLAHLRDDTIEWVDPVRLVSLARFADRLAHLLEDRPPGWTRPAA